MKKLSILIFCLSFCSFLNSQTFAPIGTKWGYNYAGVGGSGSYYIESTADTTIAGKICRKLVTQNIGYVCSTCYFYSKNVRFIYENNDSLFGMTTNGGLSLLFRYNLQLNDTLTYSANQKYLVTRKVDTLIGGQVLKKWELKTLCSDTRYSTYLIFVEKIGAFNNLIGLGYYCFSDPDYYSLCLFSSGNIQINGRCDYTKTNDLVDNIALEIQPNPTTSFLNIETEHLFSDFKIYDMAGKLIQNGVYTEGGSLDVSRLAQGIYVLQLIDKQQFTIYRKFVKSTN